MPISARSLVRQSIAEGIRPRRRRSVHEWADENRELPIEGSAESGRWRTDRNPPLRDIMDSLGPECPAIRVVVMKGTRVGCSEAGNNWIGSIIEDDPGPALMVYPTVPLAQRVSKIRIAPMIENCAGLKRRVSEARPRDSSNTVLYKEFVDGYLLMIGCQSGRALREMTIRYLYEDEVDAYPLEIEREGSTTAILERRTATFGRRRKIFMPSTPTEKGSSRIEIEFLRGDQRRYFIPCLECGHMDYLTWEGRDWLSSEAGAVHHSIGWDHGNPATAHMVCARCKAKIPELWKPWMLDSDRAEWRPTEAPQDPETISFHLSSLYSPFEKWKDQAAAFLETKRDETKLRVFVNQILGESYEYRGEAPPDAEVLRARPRTPVGVVPAGVGILVAGVDVHKDRLELQVEGFGAGEESWTILWQAIYPDESDPDPRDPVERPSLWLKLDTALRQVFFHENGRALRIGKVAIDAGYASDQVYRFAAPRWPFVVATKGVDDRDRETGRAIVGRPNNRGNRYGCHLFPIRTDAAKDKVGARLRIRLPGPGFLHFNDGLDDEWFDQLTAERKIRKSVGYRVVYSWEKIRERNEAWDLKVLCLAALYVAGEQVIRGLARSAAAWAEPAAEGDRAAESPSRPARPAVPSRRPPRPGSYLDRWKG